MIINIPYQIIINSTGKQVFSNYLDAKQVYFAGTLGIGYSWQIPRIGDRIASCQHAGRNSFSSQDHSLRKYFR